MIDMTENDFGVLVRPTEGTEDDESYGTMEVSVFSNLMPNISDDTHARYMFLAYKMAALLSFCNDNPDFDDMLEEYTHNLIEEEGLGTSVLEEEEKPFTDARAKVTSTIGNVITLNFNTKCEGEG
jgi:hypothetical protein